MLDKENRFYHNNLAKIVEKYKAKFIVIMGEKIIGVYADYETTIIETQKKNFLNVALIKECC